MKTLRHQFVEFIPDEIEEGMLYISLPYSTAVHKCACGCGNEVVTPISPNDWQLKFDGICVSLSPSIGNWNFKCNSHYWIRKGKIEHAAKHWKEHSTSPKRTKLNISQIISNGRKVLFNRKNGNK